MKKCFGILFLAAAVTVFATAPFTDTISITSTTLVPAKPLIDVSAWVTNTAYAQGGVVSNGDYYYFIAQAGTSSNAPVHTTGEVTDNSVTYRQVSKGARKGVVVSVQTQGSVGGAVNLSLSTNAAVAGRGVKLVGEGASIVFGYSDNYQGEINVISATGSNVVVGVQEF